MEAVATEAASNIISEVCKVVIGPLLQLIKDVVHLGRNTRLLQGKLTTARALVEGTDKEFQDRQRSAPPTVNDALQKLRQSVEDAERITNPSQQREGCLDRSFCNPIFCRKIRKCNIDIDNRCNNLQSAISSIRDTQEVALSAPLEAGALLQPLPESGFVGLGIRSAEEQLNRWLEDADQDHQFRVIGVFGMGGIGKTSLLKTVNNTHIKGNVFEKVIWLTVSQKFDIQDLQKNIAEIIRLDLQIGSSNADSSSAVVDIRKRRLYNFLKEKKFLLILDDVWNQIHLEELGIPLGYNKGSRVVISTRNREVIQRMGANDYSIQITPLSMEEGRNLFGRVAFNAGHASTEIVEEFARKIADKCKGLPLAINVVAAAMRGNNSADEWKVALTQMEDVDPVLLSVYTNIDKDLIQPLKWSYDRLNDRDSEIDRNIQKCFLYCGAFAEDEIIEVERLVEMWIGEGLVGSRDKSQLMETGRMYVKLLVERCLFERLDARWVLPGQKEYIRAHDIVRHMALHIAEKEGKCLFRTSESLDQFPAEQVMDDCKRIAIRYYNDDDTAFLPTDFRCPTLGTLILAKSQGLRKVPNGFLLHLPSLRVLDLSNTNITSLPESMWQLKQLEFLGLDSTKITTLPADIGNLSRLQFLHLSYCRELKSLPCTIGDLKNLKHLYLDDINARIPCGISQLTSLNKLCLSTSQYARLFSSPFDSILAKIRLRRAVLGVDEDESGMCSLKDFKNFPNLIELSVYVKPGKIVDGKRSGIKEGPMGTWLQMKHLVLIFEDDEEVMEDLPPDMQDMKNLQTFSLCLYHGISLPNCICDFQRLEELFLFHCDQLEELPPLEKLANLRVLRLFNLSKVRELGISGRVGGFPRLERLELRHMRVLESISTSSLSSNVVWPEDTMPNLQCLHILRGDHSLRKFLKLTGIKKLSNLKLPVGIEKLSNLKDIEIEKDVWERSIQADPNIKISLEEKITLL